VSASIIGIVQNGKSSLNLSADDINMYGNTNLSDVIEVKDNLGAYFKEPLIGGNDAYNYVEIFPGVVERPGQTSKGRLLQEAQILMESSEDASLSSIKSGEIRLEGGGTPAKTVLLKADGTGYMDIATINAATVDAQAVTSTSVNAQTMTATAFVKDANSTDILLANGNTLAQSSFVSKNSNGDISVGDVTASDVNVEEINVNGNISLGGNITFGTSGAT